MRFHILGPLLVVRDGVPVEVTGARLRALLIRLAVAPGRPVGADLLADAVWGASPPPEATNALQALVSRLRRALGAGAVVAVAGGYRLVAEVSDVDAYRFESAVEAGRTALRAGDRAGASRSLGDALAGREIHPVERGGTPESLHQALGLERVIHAGSVRRDADTAGTRH
jgi:DNA-binding SARP family transcriptional activator